MMHEPDNDWILHIIVPGLLGLLFAGLVVVAFH